MKQNLFNGVVFLFHKVSPLSSVLSCLPLALLYSLVIFLESFILISAKIARNTNITTE